MFLHDSSSILSIIVQHCVWHTVPFTKHGTVLSVPQLKRLNYKIELCSDEPS